MLPSTHSKLQPRLISRIRSCRNHLVARSTVKKVAGGFSWSMLRALAPAAIVETGTFRGTSTEWMASVFAARF